MKRSHCSGSHHWEFCSSPSTTRFGGGKGNGGARGVCSQTLPVTLRKRLDWSFSSGAKGQALVLLGGSRGRTTPAAGSLQIGTRAVRTPLGQSPSYRNQATHCIHKTRRLFSPTAVKGALALTKHSEGREAKIPNFATFPVHTQQHVTRSLSSFSLHPPFHSRPTSRNKNVRKLTILLGLSWVLSLLAGGGIHRDSSGKTVAKP